MIKESANKHEIKTQNLIRMIEIYNRIRKKNKAIRIETEIVTI